MKTQSMKDLILQMPFAKVIELHNPVIPVYKCMYYFPQPAVNLYLTDNTRGGKLNHQQVHFPSYLFTQSFLQKAQEMALREPRVKHFL